MSAGMACFRHMPMNLEGSDVWRTNQLYHVPSSNIQGTFCALQSSPDSTEIQRQYGTFLTKVPHSLPLGWSNYNVSSSSGNICSAKKWRPHVEPRGGSASSVFSQVTSVPEQVFKRWKKSNWLYMLHTSQHRAVCGIIKAYTHHILCLHCTRWVAN